MHILIAPNAFKNSLTATAAAEAIRDGLLQSRLNCTCECFPIGDGGDGTAELILKNCNGVRYETEVNDPFGKPINASFGFISKEETAVIEMADASGLRLLRQDKLNPLRATSYGTGQLISAALDKGAKKIILGMGGSATVDGGCGILMALGFRFLNAKGQEIEDLPEALIELNTIDISQVDERVLECEIVVLCDVDNQLLGENGAAAVFGPQKGASDADVKKLETALTHYSKLALKQTRLDMQAMKYGGTAGGAAAGLAAFIKARLVNGIDYFLELTNFDQSLNRADIVITGEGSIDEQTLQGKAPFGVAKKAKQKEIPVIALAGKIPLQPSQVMREYFTAVLCIGHGPVDLQTALAATQFDLTRTAKEIGNILAINFAN